MVRQNISQNEKKYFTAVLMTCAYMTLIVFFISSRNWIGAVGFAGVMLIDYSISGFRNETWCNVVRSFLILQSIAVLLCYFYLVGNDRDHLIERQTAMDITTKFVHNNIQKLSDHGPINLLATTPRRELHPTRLWDVKVSSPESLSQVADTSMSLIASYITDMPTVNFPDLQYRSSEEVRLAYPRIFQELPAGGFSKDVKNPCWGDKLKGDDFACLPYAYILGQPKCGTTDLFERIKQHPKVRVPIRKEVRWFSRGEFNKGIMEYEDETAEGAGHSGHEKLMSKHSSVYSFTRFFDAATRDIRAADSSENIITIDGGPHTLWWPTQQPNGDFAPMDIPPPQILREMQPNTKFIITLTDPVKRHYSDYYFLDDSLKPVKRNAPHAPKSAAQFHQRSLEQIAQFHQCVADYTTAMKTDSPELYDRLSEAAVKGKAEGKTDGVWFRAAQMCAHDREEFGRGGWGRLSIGLYALYLEKWLEHFHPDQFLVVRLEDYDEDPKGYMTKVFGFLDLEMPMGNDWDRILANKHFNLARMEREPMFEETETALREFYQPFNHLLAQFMEDVSFEWFLPVDDISGNPITLRSKQLKEQSYESVKADKTRTKEHYESNLRNGHVAPPALSNNVAKSGMVFKPKSFSIDALSASEDDGAAGIFTSDNWFRSLMPEVKHDELLANRQKMGMQICVSAYTLDIRGLKHLLYDIGAPSNIKVSAQSDMTALHCVATLSNMADAHSKSHTFALLKGSETWLTPLLKDLPKTMDSVLSLDIIETLDERIGLVGQWLLAAGSPINDQDKSGNTAMHYACVGGMKRLLEVLLKHGGDPNIRNNNKRTPLHYCTQRGHAQLAAMLIDVGKADISLRDKNGVSPMDIIENPGVISAADALAHFKIIQRPPKQIERILHPELHPDDPKLGWSAGDGGWGPERMKGFEEDTDCSHVDQYWADEITADEVFHKYLARNAPVLIRGLMDGWPAVSRYSQENLKELHGQLQVSAASIPYNTKFGGAGSRSTTLGDYIDQVKAHDIVGGKHPWYVFVGHSIPSAADGPHSLVKEEWCPLPDVIGYAANRIIGGKDTDEVHRSKELFVNAQWAFGGEGTGAPVHYHNTAWAAVYYGAKKWTLYPPRYQIMSHTQILQFWEQDMVDYHKRGIDPVTCVQMAGDVVIVPEGWGHGVLNIQETIAVATEFRPHIWRESGSNVYSHVANGFDNKKHAS